MAELMAGGLDWIWNVPPDQAKQLKAVPDLEVTSGETMRIVFLTLATPRRARRCRSSRTCGCARRSTTRSTAQAIAEDRGRRRRACCTRMCFPGQFGCTDEGAPRYDYDPAKAKALLAEAGYPNGFDIDLYAYRERHADRGDDRLPARGRHQARTCASCSTPRCATRCARARRGFAHQTWGSFSVNDVSASTPVYFKFEADDMTRDPQVRELLDAGDTSVNPTVRQVAYRMRWCRSPSRRTRCRCIRCRCTTPTRRSSSSRRTRTRCRASGRSALEVEVVQLQRALLLSILDSKRGCSRLLVALTVSLVCFLLVHLVDRRGHRDGGRGRDARRRSRPSASSTASTARWPCSTSNGWAARCAATSATRFTFAPRSSALVAERMPVTLALGAAGDRCSRWCSRSRSASWPRCARTPGSTASR